MNSLVHIENGKDLQDDVRHIFKQVCSVKEISIMQKTMKDKDKFIIEAKPKLEAYTVFLDTGVYNFTYSVVEEIN